jgi:hypothetical protein
MSDLIFYTNNEETYRISFPTLGTKCPETKLEIKMTETDISKVLIEGEYATIMGVKYKRVEEPKSFYDKLWEELGKKVGYGIDCDELTDRVMDLIKDNIPEPTGEFQPSPQTPEQVADGLKEAFREAVKQGVVSSTKSKTLTDLIYRWWDDIFTTHSSRGMETSIEDLVDQIELFLPKEQSAAGSQNAYVESAVEGFNDAIKQIKSKLR